MDKLTWTCHVCGDERPDQLISVRTRDISDRFHLPPGTAQENVRYCNDRAACVDGSKDVSFTSGSTSSED